MTDLGYVRRFLTYLLDELQYHQHPMECGHYTSSGLRKIPELFCVQFVKRNGGRGLLRNSLGEHLCSLKIIGGRVCRVSAIELSSEEQGCIDRQKGATESHASLMRTALQNQQFRGQTGKAHLFWSRYYEQLT